ncbi:MAG: hypothetical protein KA362_14670 [Chloroflexi bacterium]|nr:hypothetical protein [Chloroflexota bacterium]MBK6710702.1 hypothetical protein [Chloroflexota bacterium]MBK7179668.1 hypothetical protein [Chloroflexota bacterium]MBK7917376.1 hypothetical protein [Chloroflexota bacterium]MBK8933164.1 hypothetical protein [Chloroflexota bacterium]
MRNRIFTSVVFVVLYGFFRTVFVAWYDSVLQAQLSPLRLADASVQYGLSQSMTLIDTIIYLATLGVLSVLLFVWLSYILEKRAQEPWFVRG